MFFTVFVDMLGFGILIPVIPLLFADPASSLYLLPPGTSQAEGYILLGLLLGIYPLMQFLATPIFGQLSDKYGRKKLLAISLGGTSLSYIMFAFGILTKNIPLLFAARAFDGITGGNISVAMAAIADVTLPKDRAKNFGLIGAAFGLGFILGPYIGGHLSDPHTLSWFNAATPFWFAAALAALNMLSVVFIFPETLQHFRPHTVRLSQSVRNIFKAYSMPDMRVLFFSMFLFIAGFTFFTSFFGVFLIQRLSFDQGDIGTFFAYVGIWIAVTQVVITRWLSSRIKPYNILKISLLGNGLIILAFFLTNQWWDLLFITPVFAIFNGLTQANSTAVVSTSAGPEMQGEILGLSTSNAALAQAIPPILSGFIAASIFPTAPIIVSSVVMVIGAIFYIAFYRPRHAQTDGVHHG
jgi:MFS transporter, DHA1 family, tetracycline resistance protein